MLRNKAIRSVNQLHSKLPSVIFVNQIVYVVLFAEQNYFYSAFCLFIIVILLACTQAEKQTGHPEKEALAN